MYTNCQISNHLLACFSVSPFPIFIVTSLCLRISVPSLINRHSLQNFVFPEFLFPFHLLPSLFPFRLSSFLSVLYHQSQCPGGVFFWLSFSLALGRWRHLIHGTPQYYSISRSSRLRKSFLLCPFAANFFYCQSSLICHFISMNRFILCRVQQILLNLRKLYILDPMELSPTLNYSTHTDNLNFIKFLLNPTQVESAHYFFFFFDRFSMYTDKLYTK